MNDASVSNSHVNVTGGGDAISPASVQSEQLSSIAGDDSMQMQMQMSGVEGSEMQQMGGGEEEGDDASTIYI